MLLGALERLRDVPGWTCWIVGGAQGPDEEAVSSASCGGRCAVFDLERRVSASPASARDVPALLARRRCLLPAEHRARAFGLSFVEALHAGLPVVTSGIGGALEIVDRDCGCLLPPGDADALADALRAADRRRRAARRGSAQAARGRPAAVCDPRAEMRRLQQLLAAQRPAVELPLAALAG